jgi:hypothetical protein
MANATDKEPLPQSATGLFMLVNTGMTSATDKEPLPILTAGSKMEFGTTANS